MFELLLFGIALIGSLACGIYDLKTSNVPDSVCLLMIATGMLLNSIYGFSTGDFTNLINSFLFGGIFLGFGLLMYFTGQWGGGDGELLVAIGFLVPNLTMIETAFPFSISFFINSFFVGAVYSIAYSLALVCRNPKLSKNFMEKMTGNKMSFIMIVLFSLSISLLLLSQTIMFILLSFIAVLIIFQKFSKTIEESFYKRIPTSLLKVDDMLGEDIPGLRMYKKRIKGLTEKQVERIKSHKRYVIVREGIRYGIVFPLSLIFTYFFGDFFLFFL